MVGWFIHLVSLLVVIVLFHMAVYFVAIIELQIVEVLMTNVKFRDFIKRWYDIEGI